MKQGIHPDYHKINIVMTDGTKYETRSTWGKEGDTLQLDVDSKTHPAWVGGVHLKKTGQMEKFSNRFKGMSFESKGGAKAPAAAAPATAAAPAAEKKTEKKADKKANKKDEK